MYIAGTGRPGWEPRKQQAPPDSLDLGEAALQTAMTKNRLQEPKPREEAVHLLLEARTRALLDIARTLRKIEENTRVSG